MNSATVHTLAHRERKRARGECSYGGCREPRFKSGMCVAHYDDALERKQAGRLQKKTDAELLALRDLHAINLSRIDKELARRERLRT
jgi:hypothetical protein